MDSTSVFHALAATYAFRGDSLRVPNISKCFGKRVGGQPLVNFFSGHKIMLETETGDNIAKCFNALRDGLKFVAFLAQAKSTLCLVFVNCPPMTSRCQSYLNLSKATR